MSEYQYHEFLAVDRPLDEAAQEQLRKISSRARITSTGFANEYNYGGLRGDPLKMVERWFDLYVYVSNFGVRTLMVKLPRRLFPPEAARPYAVKYLLDVHAAGSDVILAFHGEEVGRDDWQEGAGWMQALAPIRAALAEGDLRCLYLAWLATVPGEEDEDLVEPPRPPGLGRLDGALAALVEFLEIDPDLISAAAEGDRGAGPSALGPEAMEAFVRALPTTEKDEMLMALLRGEGATLASELRRRCREASCGSAPALPSRTVGEIRGIAEGLAMERERKAAERKAAEKARKEKEEVEARALRLNALARRGDAAWQDVERLVEMKQPKRYDEAVELLRDLRALGEREGATVTFLRLLDDLRRRHAAKRAFIERLDEARLRP